MQASEFFRVPQTTAQKQYEALRAFHVEGRPATEVAEKFEYTLSAFYALNRDFKRYLDEPNPAHQFFVVADKGRKPKDPGGTLEQLMVDLRKKWLSVPDIKAILDTLGHRVSQGYIYNTLAQAGFSRLPRRSKAVRDESKAAVKLSAPPTQMLSYATETFSTRQGMGLLCLLPYIDAYGLHPLIEQSDYPHTQTLTRLCSILSFVALKLSNVRRYSHDDLWCMERGLGLFAGLNVLPKAAWFSSYSHRVTRSMNLAFLKSLHHCWQQHQLLGDSANLDFVTLPYWGETEHLEHNWSATRNKALSSILAVLAQDPDTGILTYGDTNIRHHNQSQVVLEFIDFYRADGNDTLKYLIFDSRFTTYENLKQLNAKPTPIKFITIRRRGKRIVQELEALPKSQWKSLRVPAADGKGRLLQVHEQIFFLKGYDDNIRQIAIGGSARIKPALIITNDFEQPLKDIIHKYAKRWLVEQEIDEQLQFFHFNRLSSSMVIKVDFDLTMSILAHNLYRLLATDLTGFSHSTAASVFAKFMDNGGQVSIGDDYLTVNLQKKRNIPALLTALERFQGRPISWMNNLKFRVTADASS